MRLGERLVRGGAWVVGGRIVGIGLLFTVNVLLARLLPPKDFGLFVLITSVLSFGSILAVFGLDQGIVRFVSESLAVGDTARAADVLKQGLRLGAQPRFSIPLQLRPLRNLVPDSLISANLLRRHSMRFG